MAALVATAVVVAIGYPTLVAVTAPLNLFASTTIVFGVVFAWLLLWASVELGWVVARGQAA